MEGKSSGSSKNSATSQLREKFFTAEKITYYTQKMFSI